MCTSELSFTSSFYYSMFGTRFRVKYIWYATVQTTVYSVQLMFSFIIVYQFLISSKKEKLQSWNKMIIVIAEILNQILPTESWNHSENYVSAKLEDNDNFFSLLYITFKIAGNTKLRDQLNILKILKFLLLRYRRRIRRNNIRIVEAPVRALIPASLPPGSVIGRFDPRTLLWDVQVGIKMVLIP